MKLHNNRANHFYVESTTLKPTNINGFWNNGTYIANIAVDKKVYSVEIQFSVEKRGYTGIVWYTDGPNRIEEELNIIQAVYSEQVWPKRDYDPYSSKGNRGPMGIWGLWGKMRRRD